MKTRIKGKPLAVLFSVLFILNSGGTAGASGLAKSYDLSPAMELISQQLRLKKCTVTRGETRFSGDEFETTLGRSVEYITVKSLPDPSIGILTFAGNEVTENQSFTRRNLPLLRFVSTGSEGSTEFFFGADGGDIEYACAVNVLGSENTVPTAGEMKLSAVSGIDLIRDFDGFDADGDELIYEISVYPENGIVRKNGSGFVYTGRSGFSGVDSFGYRAIDSNGAVSGEAVVTLSVAASSGKVRYDDMSGHWGYTSAVRMTELGLMSGDGTQGGRFFNPEGEISRGDFLAMAMICAGLEEKIIPNAVSTFADDSEIPRNIKSYASYAESAGIINGYATESGVLFQSLGGITRAEAATVLANLIGEPPRVHDFSFKDVASVPSWAKNGFATLVSLGIMTGTTDNTLEPNRTLTRAEASHLLCAVADYTK